MIGRITSYNVCYTKLLRKLIIYTKNFKIENKLHSNLISKEIRGIKDKFVSFKSSLSKEEAEIIKQSIYVNVNSNFFKILKQ